VSTWRCGGRGRRARVAAAPVRFAFVGRLVDWKAVDCLIEAFVRARGRAPMSLTVIGDGEQRAALEAQARRHDALAGAEGDVGRVHFAGWMSQAACAERLVEADALVLPSLHECGGAVVLRPWRSGLPVIASAWGGPLDYLDEETGVLVPVQSPERFVGGLADGAGRLAGDAGAARAPGPRRAPPRGEGVRLGGQGGPHAACIRGGAVVTRRSGGGRWHDGRREERRERRPARGRRRRRGAG
jgi:hypothetical protein